MKYEKTLPGNPNQLIVNQHVFPRSAIARFADSTGVVEVLRFEGGTPFRVRPEHELFCARRVWDQTTETLRSHKIEAEYAALADRIANGKAQTLSASDDRVVSAFLSLWMTRHYARRAPLPDATLNGVLASERLLDKQEEEVLEKHGYLFVRGTLIPSRFLNGIAMLRRLDSHRITLEGAHWGIVESDHAHFLVPDYVDGLGVIPVTPTICLCRDARDLLIGPEEVGRINRHLLESAHSYYFAQDLARCPVLRRTIPLDADGHPPDGWRPVGVASGWALVPLLKTL